jgi:hypothetical protein
LPRPRRRPRYRHFGRKAGRIDFGRRGREGKLHADFRQPLDIPLKLARIFVEVFCRCELRGIDENRHDAAIGARERLAHQRKMPLMQCAHGRHHGDAQPLPAPVFHLRAQIRDGR